MNKPPFKRPIFVSDSRFLVGGDHETILEFVPTSTTDEEVAHLVELVNRPRRVSEYAVVDVDDVLAADQYRLMEALDVVAPGWWRDYADPRDLAEFAGSVQVSDRDRDSAAIDRAVTVQKTRTLRRMRNVAWLLGHSMLTLRKRAQEGS